VDNEIANSLATKKLAETIIVTAVEFNILLSFGAHRNAKPSLSEARPWASQRCAHVLAASP
jgi:hypothetical protein